jgi:hypothetical protein
VVNDGLSEIIGPFPVPSQRDKRERNDDPGQKREGHRYSRPLQTTASIESEEPHGTDLGIGSIFDQMSGSAWSSGSKCIFEVV